MASILNVLIRLEINKQNNLQCEIIVRQVTKNSILMCNLKFRNKEDSSYICFIEDNVGNTSYFLKIDVSQHNNVLTST